MPQAPHPAYRHGPSRCTSRVGLPVAPAKAARKPNPLHSPVATPIPFLNQVPVHAAGERNRPAEPHGPERKEVDEQLSERTWLLISRGSHPSSGPSERLCSSFRVR